MSDGTAGDLGRQATALFAKEQYVQCVAVLKQLQALRPADPKVLHNLAVANFYSRGKTNLAELRNKLLEIRTKTPSSSSGSVGVAKDKDEESSELAGDNSVLAHNLACIAVSQRQFSTARDILKAQLRSIEATDEDVARRIGFLMLDLSLFVNSMDDAPLVISQLETPLRAASGGEERAEEAGSPNGSDNEGDSSIGSHSQSAGLTVEQRQLKLALHQFKAKWYLVAKTPNHCKRELNICKKELKSLPAEFAQTPSMVFLKSSMEYVRGNYKKSIKVLSSLPKPKADEVAALSTLSLNNFGCIHLQMSKPALASLYFKQALDSNERACGGAAGLPSDTNKRSDNCLADRRPEILYNQGVAFLFMNKPVLAHECLRLALEVLSHNPYVWLRLAECCISHHATEQDNEGFLRADALWKTVGTANNRKIVLQGPKRRIESPPLTLSMAVAYLRNALYVANLQSKHETVLSPPAAGSDREPVTTTSSTAGITTASSVPDTLTTLLRDDALSRFRLQAAVCLVYCYLGVEDWIKALSAARDLLNNPGCTGETRLIALMYCAEALVHLQRVAEAVQELSPGRLAECVRQEETTEADPKAKFAASRVRQPMPLSTMFLYNLACAHCLKGDLDQATVTLSQIKAEEAHSSFLVLLHVYIKLKSGLTQEAADLLKGSRSSSPL